MGWKVESPNEIRSPRCRHFQRIPFFFRYFEEACARMRVTNFNAMFGLSVTRENLRIFADLVFNSDGRYFFIFFCVAYIDGSWKLLFPMNIKIVTMPRCKIFMKIAPVRSFLSGSSFCSLKYFLHFERKLSYVDSSFIVTVARYYLLIVDKGMGKQ